MKRLDSEKFKENENESKAIFLPWFSVDMLGYVVRPLSKPDERGASRILLRHAMLHIAAQDEVAVQGGGQAVAKGQFLAPKPLKTNRRGQNCRAREPAPCTLERRPSTCVAAEPRGA